MEEINIDSVLDEFKEHLRFNDRTILSARYGDGKTYFLDKFKKKFQDKYEFITLYPVNYQISENKEIFEYIKRDILIQMVMKNMVDQNCNITEAHYLQHYIMNNHLTLLQDIIQILPTLGIGNEGFVWSTLMAGFKGLSFLESQKEKYDQFKEDIESQSDIELAEKFCDSFSDQKGSCYELDLITEIIIQSLKRFKATQHTKKVVLIIEDMDRLDPAHLFRLLNIFSAHLDRYNIYKNTSSLKEYVLSNKFGFDNIVTVFDFDNAKRIFTHFYGKDANFEGYINKFTSSYPFNYSIIEIAHFNFWKVFKDETSLNIELMSGIYIDKVKKHLKELSVRDIACILKGYNDLIKKGEISTTSFIVQKKGTLTSTIALLQMAGIRRDLISNFINELNDEEKLNCIGSFIVFGITSYTESIIYNNHFYHLLIEKNKKSVVQKITFQYGRSGFTNIRLHNENLNRCLTFGFQSVII